MHFCRVWKLIVCQVPVVLLVIFAQFQPVVSLKVCFAPAPERPSLRLVHSATPEKLKSEYISPAGEGWLAVAFTPAGEIFRRIFISRNERIFQAMTDAKRCSRVQAFTDPIKATQI